MDEVFDVVILGAGPGGCAAAIEFARQNTELKVILMDRYSFPRDKVCGDAIPGHAYKELVKILGSGAPLQQIKDSKSVGNTALYKESKKVLGIAWVLKAYNIPRLQFDDFLFQKVKNLGISTREGVTVRTISPIDNGFELTTNKGETIRCKTLLGADGANSIVQRTLAPQIANQTICVGVRAYYKNLDLDQNTTHVFYRKGVFGYFWAFPLGNNTWNLGYGILDKKKNKGTNLKQAFADFIEHNETLTRAMKNSTPLSKVIGHKIPTQSKSFKLSGNRFLLIGDAGFLVDPIAGHGIDTAMISGRIAAETIIKANEANDFSAQMLANYDVALRKSVGKRLKDSLLIRKVFGTRFWLAEILLKIITPFDKRLS